MHLPLDLAHTKHVSKGREGRMLTGIQRRWELESKGGSELLTGQKGISLLHEGYRRLPGFAQAL